MNIALNRKQYDRFSQWTIERYCICNRTQIFCRILAQTNGEAVYAERQWLVNCKINRLYYSVWTRQYDIMPLIPNRRGKLSVKSNETFMTVASVWSMRQRLHHFRGNRVKERSVHTRICPDGIYIDSNPSTRSPPELRKLVNNGGTSKLLISSDTLNLYNSPYTYFGLHIHAEIDRN